MKLWIGILIGVFIGIMIGVIVCNFITEKCYDTIEIVDDTLSFCVDELKECNNRSSTNIDICEEILDEKNIFIKEMIDKGWEDCGELLNRSKDFCDERIEEYKTFIEGECY